MSLEQQFEEAVARSKQLKERPSNDDLLALYALYKQATSGDATGDRPGMFDLVGRAKYDAWATRRGMTADAARQAYVELVASLE